MPAVSALLSVLALAQLPPGVPVSVEGIQGLDGTIRHTVSRANAEQHYEVLVGLPDGYDASASRRYPVVYVLDAGIHYPVLRTYHEYMTNSGRVPEVIFVGISYGTSDWQAGNNRSHDFTAPSDEREYWGGASDFLDFLELELIPGIEDAYRADPERRVVFGQSLGGQFVLFAAQTRPEVFWGYIASNPALHRNLEYFLRTAPAEASDRRVFVASGSDDTPRFRIPAVEWIEHWTAIDAPPWSLEAVTLEGHFHFSAPPTAYRLGMQWLFDVSTGTDSTE